MSHAGIQSACNLGTHRPKYAFTLPHAGRRNVRVDIAAAEKDGGPVERALEVLPARPRFADECAAQGHQARIAARMTQHELRRETRALREAEQHDLARVAPLVDEV